MQEVSHPGVKERADSVWSMASNYPIITSIFLFVVLVFLVHRESKKEKTSIFKILVYLFVALFAFWRAAKDI